MAKKAPEFQKVVRHFLSTPPQPRKSLSKKVYNSPLEYITDLSQTSRHVRKVPILLQKSVETDLEP
jgi:hypothetical protein